MSEHVCLQYDKEVGDTQVSVCMGAPQMVYGIQEQGAQYSPCPTLPFWFLNATQEGAEKTQEKPTFFFNKSVIYTYLYLFFYFEECKCHGTHVEV